MHTHIHTSTIIGSHYSCTLVDIYLILLHVHNNVRIHTFISDKIILGISKLKLRNNYTAYM